MLALVCRDKLSNASVDSAKLHSVTIQVDSWSLHLTDELEEKWVSIRDKNLEVLLNRLLIYKVG